MNCQKFLHQTASQFEFGIADDYSTCESLHSSLPEDVFRGLFCDTFEPPNFGF